MVKSFSSGEVAKMCDVTPRTIIRWIEAGRLKAFKLPGRGNNRIAEHDLLDFLANNAIPVPNNLLSHAERHCIIVSKDAYVTRHANRMIRDADFFTHIFNDEFEAGLQISSKQPELVVLDQDCFDCVINDAAKLVALVCPSVKQIVLLANLPVEATHGDGANSMMFINNTQVHVFNKPIDLHQLSVILDGINGQDDE